MVTIAHLSDPHLAPLPPPGARRLLSKRIVGYMNWLRRRQRFHLRPVLDMLIEDLLRQRPDHIVVTGDLVNIALEEEFVNARTWLSGLGEAGNVTVVPGNHDAYVTMPWELGAGQWQEHMTPDDRGRGYTRKESPFPFVRMIGQVALIGLTSSVPTPFFRATGTLGVAQLDALAEALDALRRDGLYRIVLIHHPPLKGLATPRKALTDAAELERVLIGHGADLVLHGHNHRDMLNVLQTGHGNAHILGVPSASAGRDGRVPSAQYNLYEITGDPGAYACSVTVRGYDVHERAIAPVRTFPLDVLYEGASP